MHQVLEHIFQDGLDSKRESTEDETASEHEKFSFNDVQNERTESVSCENTQQATGPAQALASGASIIALTNVSIFNKNMIIDDKSGISNKDGDL